MNCRKNNPLFATLLQVLYDFSVTKIKIKIIRRRVFSSNVEIINAVTEEAPKHEFESAVYQLEKCMEINGNYVQKLK